MKAQKGFGLLLAIILIMAGIAGAGGYAVYRDSKDREASVIDMPIPEAAVDTQPAMSSQIVPVAVSTSENISVSAPPSSPVVQQIATSLSCMNDNYQCLISAAATCREATGVMSYTLQTGLPGLLKIGKNKFEIKNSGAGCTLTYTPLEGRFIATAEGRADAKKEGVTDAEVDEQINAYNDAQSALINIKNTCISDSDTIVSFLTDQENGVTGESNGFSFNGSVSESTTKTTSGKEITCTMPQPAPTFTPAQ